MGRKTFRRFCVASALAAFLLFVAATLRRQTLAVPAGSKDHAPAEKTHLDGVRNFGKVTPSLYRGGQPSTQGFKGLAKLGINIVVDLRLENQGLERKKVNQDGMRFVGLPWSCHDPNDKIVERFLALVQANPGKKIFLHCHYGVDRTGMLVAAFRMAEQGWTPPEAMREMRAFGDNVLHRTWCRAVVKYTENFSRQYSTDPVFLPLKSAPHTPAR